MKAKYTKGHTPAPWLIEFEEGRFLITDKSDDTYFVAVIRDHFNNAKANAQLIAAAPDLLEACIKSLTIFKGLSDAGKYPELMMAENGGKGFKFLTDTITKATGGQP